MINRFNLQAIKQIKYRNIQQDFQEKDNTLLPAAQQTPHFIAHELQENPTAHSFVSFIRRPQNVRTE